MKKHQFLPPALPDPDHVPIVYEPLTPESPEADVTDSDFNLSNVICKNLYKHWSEPNLSIKEVVSLGKFTLSFIKERRSLMKMEYGPTRSKEGKHIVYPLD